jgi:superfamily II DNA/RNA helicase
MAGRDVLGIAQTGTGKTASFTLPMISRLETGRARARMPRSLILAPTRELAAQVAQSFEKYGINHKLDVALLIGGVSMDEQTKKLDRGVDVLIATPGRLMDHFQRGRVMLMGVEILVIDEADRMLDMGFIPDIEKICKLLPPRKQTLFFSATMPAEITRLTQQFLVDPVRIEVAPPATSAKTITQAFAYCSTGEDWAKRDTLRTLLRGPGVRNAIIFANRKVEVAILLKSLVKHGFNAGAIHGDMDQKARTETLDKFRNGEIQYLVGSDVAARGLDIPDVSHVFNYDLPRDKDDYVHRIGRTGRAQCVGDAISFVTNEDHGELRALERFIGRGIVRKKAEGFNYSQSAPPFNPDEDRRPRTPRPPPRQGGRPSGPPRSQGGGGGGQHRSSQGGQAPRPPQGGGRPQGGRPQFSSSHAPRPQRDDGGRREEPNGNREGGNLRHFPSTAPRQGGFRRRFGPR